MTSPGRGDGRKVQNLVAGRNDVHCGLLAHLHLEDAAAEQGPDVVRGQNLVLGQNELSGHNVLSDAPHVLPGMGRSLDVHGLLISLMHMFDHDHGIGKFRHGVSSVYRVVA